MQNNILIKPVLEFRPPKNKFYAIVDDRNEIVSYHSRKDLAKCRARFLWREFNGKISFYVYDLDSKKNKNGITIYKSFIYKKIDCL